MIYICEANKVDVCTDSVVTLRAHPLILRPVPDKARREQNTIERGNSLKL